MRICFICEGSYPYIAGGVSGWIQMLLERFSDIEFVIWCIATNRQEMSEYRYELPPNVKEVQTIYLTEQQFKGRNRHIKLSKAEKIALHSLLSDDITLEVDWKEILALLKNHRDDLVDILMGHDFFEIAVELYQKSYARVVFHDYLWNLRSMYFPLVSAINGEMVKADVYHSVSTGYAGLLGSIAAQVYEKPYVITEHGIYTREREEEIIKSDWVSGEYKKNWIDFFNKISQIAYHSADKVFTLFETNRQLEIELGCPEEKISIIPNGVDVGFYEKLQSVGKISKDTFNIGVVARVVPIKDIKTMLYAFDIAKQKVPHLALHILGPTDEDEEYYAECLELAEELELKDIYFTGRVAVSQYLPDFDVCLLTSISEGQPLAVLESAAAYLPQICTNVGSCANLLHGYGEDTLGEAGIIVPVMDIEKIAAAMVRLASDKELCHIMGQVGHDRVEKYYQKEAFLSRYYEEYLALHQGAQKKGG